MRLGMRYHLIHTLSSDIHLVIIIFRGIQTELDEIESRMEEYPLTQAMLKLLDTLTDFGIPRTLGAGPRKPGFDPYLSFILNCVFLKYNSRYV